MGKLISTNPATGEVLRELDTTPIEELPRIFERARAAQGKWAALTPKRRATYLLQLRETLLNHVDETADLISRETGKPRFESLSHEILPCVEGLTFLAKKGPKILRDHPIKPGLVKYRRSYLNYWPLGVVAIISPWNFPLMLAFQNIISALIAGNAVIFKPSEITPLVGLKIQELCDEAGIPPDLVQTVIGDGSLGAAIIDHKPNKIFFTGSPSTGRKVMKAAAEHLIPVSLELGGNNPLIVLPKANLDFATSAALYGCFANSGQICAQTSRVLVHESMAPLFVDLLKRKVETLRQGPPISEAPADMGAVTFEKQKAIYDRHLAEAREKGAEIVTGGGFSTDRRFLAPTIVRGPGVEDLSLYREETFGPIVAISTFRSLAEAVEKANRTAHGLTASVITRDLALGESVAKQIEAGSVMINEVLYTAGAPEAPWGGIKESGFGRTHSEIGLHEFVNVRHIDRPRSRLFSFKSLWWFPYTPYQYATFREFLNVYRRHLTDRLRAIPMVLWNFVQFLKNEKRL